MSQFLVVPEFILHSTLLNTLEFLRKDYNDQTNKDQSYLSKLLSQAGFQRYKYKEQGIILFTATNEDPRYLDVDLMFNMKREGMPTIHITMPSESPGQNSLGVGQTNYTFYNEELINDELQATSSQEVFQRRYRATYDIVIVSDNSNEVVMIYHVLKSLLTALSAHLTLSGLENLTFSGQDLQPYAELAPKNVFLRAIRVGLEYDSFALNFEKHPIIKDIVFENKVVD